VAEIETGVRIEQIALSRIAAVRAHRLRTRASSRTAIIGEIRLIVTP